MGKGQSCLHRIGLFIPGNCLYTENYSVPRTPPLCGICRVGHIPDICRPGKQVRAGKKLACRQAGYHDPGSGNGRAAGCGAPAGYP